MTREFKPGDVVLVMRINEPTIAIRGDGQQEGWWLTPHGSGLYEGDEIIRPLVVLDPEDREQVERLATLRFGWRNSIETDRMQAALREFADPKPPKPDEPTGRFAVVVDADEEEWVRGHDGRWHFSSPAALQPHSGWITRDWERIDVVRVLSEGVS